MNFKETLLRRPSVDEGNARNSTTLPKFSFESDERPLVSTERLFRQWQDEESQYDPAYQYVESELRTEYDVIVWSLPIAAIQS